MSYREISKMSLLYMLIVLVQKTGYLATTLISMIMMIMTQPIPRCCRVPCHIKSYIIFEMFLKHILPYIAQYIISKGLLTVVM